MNAKEHRGARMAQNLFRSIGSLMGQGGKGGKGSVGKNIVALLTGSRASGKSAGLGPAMGQGGTESKGPE